jgi:hypothetical protein
VHELSAKQTDDQACRGSDADPPAVDAALRLLDGAGLREADDFCGMTKMREARENLVALRFERALIEMRIGLRAGGCPVRLECGVLVQLADVASAHA